MLVHVTRRAFSRRKRKWGIVTDICSLAWFPTCYVATVYLMDFLESLFGESYRKIWISISVVFLIVAMIGGLIVIMRLGLKMSGQVCPHCAGIVDAKFSDQGKTPDDFLDAGMCNRCGKQAVEFDDYHNDIAEKPSFK